jgi:predicted phage tail protein
LHFDFIGSHVAHLNRDCASRRSSPNQYPGAIVVKQHLFLPLAAIILASSVWASASSSSGIRISTAALSFDGSSGNVTSLPITLTVTGSQPVTITSATYSNGNFFSTPINLPVTLPSGQSITGQISARPQSTPQTGKFTIVSNVGTYTVSLSETPAAQAPTSYQVNLTWKAPASSSDPVDSYQVNRAVAGSTAYSTVGTTTAGSTTFADTSVKAGTTYQYEVRSVDDQGGTSGPSNPITLAIP